MTAFHVCIHQSIWKGNFAWVIAMEPFLIQNLSLVSFLFLEIWRTNFPSQKGGNKSLNLYIYRLEMGLNSKKWGFYVRGRFFQPKIDPPSISAISKQKKFLYFQNVLKSSSSPPGCSVVQFCKNFLKICLKNKTKSQLPWTFKHDRSIGCRQQW